MNTTRSSAIALIAAVAILLTGTIPANAAASIGCDGDRTYGWVTSPVAGQAVGTRHCRAMSPGAINGEIAFWFRSTAYGTWIPTSNNAPNMGGAAGTAGRAHADAAKALAARWGTTLHITKHVGRLDRVGWIDRDGSYGFHGVYYPSPQRPGKGLIEISAGGKPLGLADSVRGNAFMRQAILNTTRHEIAHARIEHRCGTWTPPIARDRIENVTDAYAVTFLGKTTTSYGYTAADVTKARAIAGGNCG